MAREEVTTAGSLDRKHRFALDLLSRQALKQGQGEEPVEWGFTRGRNHTTCAHQQRRRVHSQTVLGLAVNCHDF